MVLNKELVNLRGFNQGRVVCFAHTNDKKTMFVGSRDGRICLYSCLDKYKHLTTIQPYKNETNQDEIEVTAMQYVQISHDLSYLVVGGSSGQICIVDLTTMQVCWKELTDDK